MNGDPVLFGALQRKTKTTYTFACPSCAKTRAARPGALCPDCKKRTTPARRGRKAVS